MVKTDMHEENHKPKICKLAVWSIMSGAMGPLFWGLPIVVSIAAAVMAIKQIRDSQGLLRGKGYAVAGILISALWTLVIVGNMASPSPLEEFQAQAGYLCRSQLAGLGETLLSYAKSNGGKWPAGEKWCDSLEDMGTSREEFKCLLDAEGPCSYAMNKYAEKVGSGMPAEMVLLFESQPGWNQVGGADILSTENHGGKGCNILFGDGRAEFVKTKDLGKLKWKAEENSE